MSILKKWAGCVISFVAGVLGLALSASTGMKITTPLGSSTTKAHKVITDSDLMDMAEAFKIDGEFVLMKVFAIITLIVSALLIIYSIICLLQNLKVIKLSTKVLTFIELALVVLLLVATIGLLIASNNYASAMEDAMAIMGVTKVGLGVYQPVMLTVAIITAVVTGIFSFLKKKGA